MRQVQPMTMIEVPDDLMHKEIEVGRFAVTADDIRVFAEAVNDLNPLYLDPEAARQAGYPNVIAPPTYCMHLRGSRIVPEVPLAPGLASLYAGQEFEFHDELYAGRTYTVTARLGRGVREDRPQRPARGHRPRDAGQG